jgi:hypothetical protein
MQPEIVPCGEETRRFEEFMITVHRVHVYQGRSIDAENPTLYSPLLTCARNGGRLIQSASQRRGLEAKSIP